jgi:hypothetical protein
MAMISFLYRATAIHLRQTCFHREFTAHRAYCIAQVEAATKSGRPSAPQRDMCRLMASGMVFRTTSWICWLNDSSRDDGVAS